MNGIDLQLEEPGFPELANKKRVIHLGEGTVIGVAALKAGTSSGAPSVALKFDLPDGSTVLVETTLALFLTAADALKERFGDPRWK